MQILLAREDTPEKDNRRKRAVGRETPRMPRFCETQKRQSASVDTHHATLSASISVDQRFIRHDSDLGSDWRSAGDLARNACIPSLPATSTLTT